MAIHLPFKRGRLKTAGLILSLSLSLLVSAGLNAQQNQSVTVPKNCLWEVKGTSNTVFLLRSLHFLKSDTYPLAAAINGAYSRSRKVVFETDMGAMVDPAVQARILHMALYPEGQSLLPNLPDDMRAALQTKMADLGLPMDQFVRFKPWFIALTITAKELERLEFSPDNGIDAHFDARARSDQKKIGYFESVDYQLDLLGNMGTDDQMAFLGQTLKDLQIAGEMAEDIVKYWQKGQVDKLYSLLFKSFKDYPEIEERLLLQRNKDWVKKIEAMLGEPDDTFIVVGAGHLVGPQSVVDLLRQRGYTVKQQ